MDKAEFIFNKLAQVEYQEQQKRVARRISEPNRHGLLVYHGLGSGKTLSSIFATQELGANATVVVPASLKENFKKEIKKAKMPQNRFSIMSYEKFVKNPNITKTDLLIADEVQKLKNSDSLRSRAVRLDSNKFKKVLLLTGSPIQNTPSEIAPIINAVSGQNRLPLSERVFNKLYVKQYIDRPNLFEKIFTDKQPVLVKGIKNKELFRNQVSGLVDYYAPTQAGYPSVTAVDVPVDLNETQSQLYDYFEKKLPSGLKEKIKYALPPTKQEAPALNAFFSAVRQISNTPESFLEKSIPNTMSPKIQAIVDNVTNSPNQSLVYSNYLGSGVESISKQLSKNKVPHGVFTGDLSSKEKNELVKKYNSGKIKSLLVSSSGGEGLDLKNTREVHILEPHFNKSKIDQVIGRAARYLSHSDLPVKEQNVTVFKYTSRLPLKRKTLLQKLHLTDPTRNPSIDQYLESMGQQKEELNEEFLQVLREEGSVKR